MPVIVSLNSKYLWYVSEIELEIILKKKALNIKLNKTATKIQSFARMIITKKAYMLIIK